MSSLTAEAHSFSIKNIFPRMGRVRSTQQILDALQNHLRSGPPRA